MKRPTNMRPNLSFIGAINSNLIPHNVNAFLDNFKELLLSTTLENYNDIEKIESLKKWNFSFSISDFLAFLHLWVIPILKQWLM